MARRQDFHRNAQIECSLGICQMHNKCQQPKNCADGTGFILVDKTYKPLYKKAAQPEYKMPVMKRVKCCREAVSEPCPGCPNIPF
jgi:hypothetical protein